MRRGLLVILGAAILGSMAGLGGWYAFAPDEEPPAEEEAKPALDEWLATDEQQMLIHVVEAAREEQGWAAGCLWREDGEIRSIIYPPRPAIADRGVMPAGRNFSVLSGPGQSSGQYTTIESDEHFCIVPAGRGSGGEDIIRHR